MSDPSVSASSVEVGLAVGGEHLGGAAAGDEPVAAGHVPLRVGDLEHDVAVLVPRPGGERAGDVEDAHPQELVAVGELERVEVAQRERQRVGGWEVAITFRG